MWMYIWQAMTLDAIPSKKCVFVKPEEMVMKQRFTEVACLQQLSMDQGAMFRVRYMSTSDVSRATIITSDSTRKS